MSEKKPGAALDPSVVRELAAILKDSGLSEIEYEQGELKLRLTRGAAAAPMATLAPAPVAAVAPAAPAAAAPPPAPSADLRQHPGAVTSPMVGTIYLAPDPDSAPFVKEGDSVSEGQTLMIVEAMKTFNPIPAPRAGVVRRVLVADRQPVEFGEALALVE